MIGRASISIGMTSQPGGLGRRRWIAKPPWTKQRTVPAVGQALISSARTSAARSWMSQTSPMTSSHSRLVWRPGRCRKASRVKQRRCCNSWPRWCPFQTIQIERLKSPNVGQGSAPNVGREKADRGSDYPVRERNGVSAASRAFEHNPSPGRLCPAR